MNFFRGLASVTFIYTIMWCIYNFGYSRGADAESYSRALASMRLANCSKIIAEGRK